MNEDSIKATPQNPILGLFANGMSAADNYVSDKLSPVLADGLGLSPAARLLQNMSYGSPPFRGSGMATRLSPDIMSTAGAALNYGGIMPMGTAAKVGTGLLGYGIQQHESLDSVIQNLLNALGRQTQGR